MIHDSTWLDRTRAMRWKRLTAPVGFLLACALLVALPTAALATTPEMRGEWELVVKEGPNTLKGTTLISEEANAKGEFASHTVQFENGVTGTFSGTLEGSKASVKVTTAPFGPVGEGEFTSTTMTVESGAGTLALSGSGTLKLNGQTGEATLKATRIKTQQQIEEQEARERREREEQEARANVRGEWTLTIESGPQTVKGTALITEAGNAKNEFASSSALFENGIPGTFSGKLNGSEALVTITTQATGPFPAGTFTSTTIVVQSAFNPASMSGSGTLTVGTNEAPATLTATKIRTYQQIVEQEAREREAGEQQEREAKEKLEREAQEKLEREAKEKQEREAREAAATAAGKTTQQGGGSTPTLLSVELAGKSFTVGGSKVLSLQLTNPNPYAISGRVTLLVAGSGRAGKSSTTSGGASKKAGSLGTVSFGVAPNGKQLVKLKLSHRGRAELAHHKTLHVLATITTQANGQTTTTKTFSLTLHAAKPARAKH